MKNLKREILLWMDASGSVEQVNNYYAYGGLLNDVPASVDVQTHKYNGKELDLMHGLNEYDYGARQYDPAIAQFTTVDPLCEKYYHISPYAYCGGNPVNRVDPDGRDFIIHYYYNNVEMTYTYMDGGANKSIPNNTFVKSVIQAYQYNKKNWIKAGYLEESPSILAATSKKYHVHIYQDFENKYSFGVRWNPNLGLLTETGVVLSPATSLDHEIDHAYQAQANNSQYKNDAKGPNRKDSQYDTKEERRVICGSEQKTSLANGERNNNQVTRKSHRGTTVIVPEITSTIADKAKTKQYENELYRRKTLWSSE